MSKAVVHGALQNGLTGRRQFVARLAAIPLTFTTAAGVFEDPLYVLKGDNTERLRTDFNSNRDKARLVFMLSPT